MAASDLKPLPDRIIALLLLGDSSSGKSSLIESFIHHRFPTTPLRNEGSFMSRRTMIGDIDVNIQLWDTIGQKRYMDVLDILYCSKDGFIFVYDVTSRESFNSLVDRIRHVEENSPGYDGMIIAAKSDLKEERVVTEGEGRTFARRFDFSYAETSSRRGDGIEEAILDFTKRLLSKPTPDRWGLVDLEVHSSVSVPMKRSCMI